MSGGEAKKVISIVERALFPWYYQYERWLCVYFMEDQVCLPIFIVLCLDVPPLGFWFPLFYLEALYVLIR